MTIRTPFYFVICAEGRDDSAPQPVVDAADYHSSDEDEDEDSSCSSTFTDNSEDSMTYDDCDMDLDLDLDVMPLSRSCDEVHSHSMFMPSIDNYLPLIPGFEEWEEAIKFDGEDVNFDMGIFDSDLFEPTERTMHSIDVNTNDSAVLVSTGRRTNL
eukprot:scaffold6784_cov108-Cylindrotheca_fusiformis.AAC.7